MIIINEDTLIHTDSSSDVIEHFGVKGMRWGQRRVISNRGAARAQKRIKKLKARTANTMKNTLKDIGYSALLGGQPEQIRYSNNKSLENNQAKLLSNKKGISYKDAKAEIRSKTWGKSDAAKAAYKETKSQYGRKDLRTKAAKSDYKSAKASAQATELKKYYGDWHKSAGNADKLNRKSAHEAEKAKRYRMGV